MTRIMRGYGKRAQNQLSDEIGKQRGQTHQAGFIANWEGGPLHSTAGPSSDELGVTVAHTSLNP